MILPDARTRKEGRPDVLATLSRPMPVASAPPAYAYALGIPIPWTETFISLLRKEKQGIWRYLGS